MRRLLAAACPLALAGLAAAPAAARTTVHPYLEVQQVFSADLDGHGDSVTYTGVAAGVDATLDGAHVQGQIAYRYDHYVAWSKRYSDSDVHNGLASIQWKPDADLTLQASGIASRVSGSYGRRTSAFALGDLDNSYQVYAFDVGPRYAHSFGDLDVAAQYDFGWAKTTDGIGTTDLGPGQPLLDNNFTTTSHTAQASVGMRPGGAGLPFGWSVSGGYVRDSIGFLDARYEGKFGRADVTLPVSSDLAFTGGVGYEQNQTSQAAILTDADGNAILNAHRHLQADHSKKRILSYDQDGLIWDVGVIWRPSPRTFVELHGGRRYGGRAIWGRAEHQISETTSLSVVAYDDLQSFGRQLTGGIGALPTSFTSTQTPFPTTVSLCVFGTNGGTGACLPALSGANSNFYRSRGVYGTVSGTRGLWTWGVGVNYDWRRYLEPAYGGDIFTFSGQEAQTVTINGLLSRRLSRESALSLTALAAWYDAGAFDTDYTSYGGSLAYSRTFGRHLSGNAALGIWSGSAGQGGGDVNGSALLSLRYTM
jgi:hypothetical protein